MSPTYTIRESRKAKHVSLKVSVSGSLEVVIPPGFDRKRIPAIVQKKQRWLDQVKLRLEGQQEAQGTGQQQLPDRISLQAIAQEWQVEYSPARWIGVKLCERPNFNLVLSGEVHNQSACQSILRHWIASKARTHLPPWLRQVSQEVDLPFEQVAIRQQKTLWGSCSARKTISLNSKLLFLPTQLVRYVLIHELCHTIHLNHSADFWALVGSYEANYRQLDNSLRDARYCVPLWMES